jgi:adenylyl cyclase-associated protein
MEAKLGALIERLEKATVRLESISTGGSVGVAGAIATSDVGQSAGPALVAFDEVIAGAFTEFLALSKTIGGLVAEQVAFKSDTNMTLAFLGIDC